MPSKGHEYTCLAMLGAQGASAILTRGLVIVRDVLAYLDWRALPEIGFGRLAIFSANEGQCLAPTELVHRPQLTSLPPEEAPNAWGALGARGSSGISILGVWTTSGSSLTYIWERTTFFITTIFFGDRMEVGLSARVWMGTSGISSRGGWTGPRRWQ